MFGEFLLREEYQEVKRNIREARLTGKPITELDKDLKRIKDEYQRLIGFEIGTE